MLEGVVRHLADKLREVLSELETVRGLTAAALTIDKPHTP